MSLDTPATIVIIGAGPVGLEAALYARYLGYEVIVLEAESVGASLTRWGDRVLPDPFGELASPLALRALSAQNDSFDPPAGESQVTGIEFLQQFLLPLSESDLLAESLRCPVRVTSIQMGEPERIELEWEDDDELDDVELSLPYLDRPTFILTIESEESEVPETIRANAVIDARGRAPQTHEEAAVCGVRPLDDLADSEVLALLGGFFFRLGAVTDEHVGLTPFRMSHGRDQIRAVFAKLGGRANLDLYQI